MYGLEYPYNGLFKWQTISQVLQIADPLCCMQQTWGKNPCKLLKTSDLCSEFLMGSRNPWKIFGYIFLSLEADCRINISG
jgi:hypothetical protein